MTEHEARAIVRFLTEANAEKQHTFAAQKMLATDTLPERWIVIGPGAFRIEYSWELLAKQGSAIIDALSQIGGMVFQLLQNQTAEHAPAPDEAEAEDGPGRPVTEIWLPSDRVPVR